MHLQQVGTGKIKLFQTLQGGKCSDSTIILVTVNPRPEKPVIYRKGFVLYSSSKTGNQWFLFDKPIQPDLAITGSLGYWSFGAKGSNEVAKATFSTIPLNAGIQYRFPTSGFYPFIGAETFLFFNSVSVEYLGYKSSDSETKFGFVPLVGGAFKIAPNLELRVSLKYTIIFTSGSNTTYLNLLGGIHFFI